MYKWKPDTDEVINNCFEFDWNHSRVHKVIKNEEQLEQTKQFFKERYRFLRNSYKHYGIKKNLFYVDFPLINFKKKFISLS